MADMYNSVVSTYIYVQLMRITLQAEYTVHAAYLLAAAVAFMGTLLQRFSMSPRPAGVPLLSLLQNRSCVS